MPLGIAAEMSDDELAALEALRDPNEEPLPGDDEPGADGSQPPQEPAASQTPPDEGAPKADATPPADDKQQTADPEKPKGNRNQALRASRIAEQRARQEAEALRAELEELRKQVPAGKKEAELADMTDEEIADLEIDSPTAAKVARMAKRTAELVAKLAPAQQTTPTADPDFTPVELPPELQAAVDENETLLGWQHDPDQTRFELATATDGLLSRHPQWKGKPLEERFNEVVKRVNAELGAAKPTPAANGRRDPMDVINNAPSRTPKSISEIGGGDGHVSGPDVGRFSRMSAEDVEAELMARGG